MLRYRLLPLGIIISIAFTACVLAQESGLTNTTFLPDAAGAGPADWRFVDFGTGGKPAYEPRGGQDGSGAVGVTVESAEQRGAWQQRLQLDGRKALHVSGVYRTEGVIGSGAMLRLTWLRGEAGWDFVSDVRLPLDASEDWASFEEVFVAPPEAEAVAPELFNFFGIGTVWWDRVEIREATPQEVARMAARRLDREPAEGEVNYSPAADSVSPTNPPAFVWLPVDFHDKWVLQYAPDGEFNGPDAVTVTDWPSTVYTPQTTIAPGVWAWRFGFVTDDGPVFSRTRQFTVPEDAVEFPLPRMDDVMRSIPKVHPRAYYKLDELAELRRKVSEEPEHRRIAADVLTAAERYLGEELYPEPDYLPSDGLEHARAYKESFDTMRPFTARMEVCANAWVLSGDERFGAEAKRRLMHLMSWDPDGPTSVWSNDEAAMDIAMRGPRTYDWIHELLSDEERETCRTVLARRMQQINELHRRMPFESRPYSSHPGRMIGFIIEGAIILAHEVPEAKDWLDYTLRLLWSVYPAWGNPDGGWAEGPGYWNAYIGMLQPPLLLLDSIGVPFKNKPFCANNGWFGLYAVPVGAKMRPFGDGHEGSTTRGDGSVLYRWATLYQNGYWRWYAEQLGADHGSQAGEFGYYDPDLVATPPSDIPQGRVFPDIGLAAMHSDLADPAENVYLLMRSSPYGAVSHSHASQNAIAISAFGEALAISSGYYQLYGSPHHSQWTWDTKAHNSILVNGEGQVKRSPSSRGRIVQFDTQEEYAYTAGDATEAYGGRLKRFLRRVLFIRPDIFVICDELEAAAPATYQWLLHARNEMALEEAAQAVTISAGDARLHAQFLQPQGLRLSQVSGFQVEPEREAPDQFHFTAETTEPALQAVFLTVLTAHRSGASERIPRAEVVEAEGGAALRLTWPDESALVLWRLGDAREVRAGDASTRAEVAVIRRDAAGAVTGSYSCGATSLAGE